VRFALDHTGTGNEKEPTPSSTTYGRSAYMDRPYFK